MKFKAYIYILILLFTIACNKQETHWQTDVLVPIVTSEMTMANLLSSDNIIPNPDQSLSYIIEEKIDLLNADSIVDIQDTLAVDIFNVPFTFKIPPGQKVIKKVNTSVINFGELELTKAITKRVKMKFFITNSITQPLLVRYELFSAKKDELIYVTEEKVEAPTDGGKVYEEKEVILDGYSIDFTGPNHDAVNTIYSQTTVWIHPDADTATITPTDTLMIISTFEEFVPEYAYGYLGSQSLSSHSAVAINTFDGVTSGSFDLNSVNASIDIYNYLGVDLSMEIKKIATKNTLTNTSIELNHSIIGSSLNFSRGIESGDMDYPVYPNRYLYDISNSNLDEMIEIMPDSFIIEVDGIINPLGNISAGNDFIYFDHGLDAKVKLEIPLNLSVSNMIIEDTTSINFTDEGIMAGFLNINFENKFPFDLNIQFYILNSSNSIIDSVFYGGTLITAGEINQFGIVEKSSKSILKVKLTESVLSAMRNNDRMLLRAKVNSVNQIKYELYQDYGLKVKVIGDFEYEM